MHISFDTFHNNAASNEIETLQNEYICVGDQLIYVNHHSTSIDRQTVLNVEL